MMIFLAIVALGVLILVHELGHFIAAKLSGVYVERFSIGFGPRLFSVKKGDTEYCISAIPLGGYVKLHRMFEEEEKVPGRENQAFYNKSFPKKIFIITAGVLFNFLFAIFLYSMINMLGYKEFSPVISGVEENSPAYFAEFKAGDKVTSVGSISVKSWGQFDSYLHKNAREGVSMPISVEREGKTVVLKLIPEFKEDLDIFKKKRLFPYSGLLLSVEPIIGAVSPEMPADKAGLKEGDRFISIDGVAINDWSEVGKEIGKHPNQEIAVVVDRQGEKISKTLLPVEKDINGTKKAVIGVTNYSGDLIIKDGVGEAFYHGAERAFFMTGLMYKGLWTMVSGKGSREDLGGPILIVQEGAKSAGGGYERYLAFIAFISINLAILNLLPIPVLDGGYVIMYIVEALTRRKISVKVRAGAQQVGFTLLMLLMVFAFYNDITRFFK